MWSKNTSRGEKGVGDAGNQGSAGAGTAQLFLGLVFEKRFGTEEWEDERTTKDKGVFNWKQSGFRRQKAASRRRRERQKWRTITTEGALVGT